MKTHPITLFFVAILIVGFFTTCQKEVIDVKKLQTNNDLTEIDFTQVGAVGTIMEARGMGMSGGGGMGGDSGAEPIYRVTYYGELSGVAYGPATKDNKVAQVISAGKCTPFEIGGIPALVGGCFTHPLVNIWGPVVRLIDRRVDEQDIRVSVRLFINYEGSNHWVNFFGSICDDNLGACNIIGSGTSILPTQIGANNAVWIKLDRMVVDSGGSNPQLGCEKDVPLTKDVRVEIQLEADPWPGC